MEQIWGETLFLKDGIDFNDFHIKKHAETGKKFIEIRESLEFISNFLQYYRGERNFSRIKNINYELGEIENELKNAYRFECAESEMKYHYKKDIYSED